MRYCLYAIKYELISKSFTIKPVVTFENTLLQCFIVTARCILLEIMIVLYVARVFGHSSTQPCYTSVTILHLVTQVGSYILCTPFLVELHGKFLIMLHLVTVSCFVKPLPKCTIIMLQLQCCLNLYLENFLLVLQNYTWYNVLILQCYP